MFYNPDKLGYYTVGDFKTYNKFYAVQEMQKTNTFLHWHFNDAEYSKVDWKTNPGNTLSKLYKNRAVALRKKYDYLVLFYSGGSDSVTILNTFIEHNIPIDEIASCYSKKGSDSSYFNEEIEKVVLPNVNASCEKTGARFRLIDQTDMITGMNDPMWYVHTNNFITPNCVTRARFRDLIPEYKNMIASGMKVGFIWGRDKPRIICDEDHKFYTEFIDAVDNNTSPYSQNQAHRGWYDEFFFHDPEHTDILQQQVHIVVDALMSRRLDAEFYQDSFTPNGKCPHTQKYLTNAGLISLIYPDFDLTTFSNGKNPSDVFGARDDWFFKTQPEPAYSLFINGVIELSKIYQKENEFSWVNPVEDCPPPFDWINDIIKNNNATLFTRVKGVLTPRYYIT